MEAGSQEEAWHCFKGLRSNLKSLMQYGTRAGLVNHPRVRTPPERPGTRPARHPAALNCHYNFFLLSASTSET